MNVFSGISDLVLLRLFSTLLNSLLQRISALAFGDVGKELRRLFAPSSCREKRIGGNGQNCEKEGTSSSEFYVYVSIVVILHIADDSLDFIGGYASKG